MPAEYPEMHSQRKILIQTLTDDMWGKRDDAWHDGIPLLGSSWSRFPPLSPSRMTVVEQLPSVPTSLCTLQSFACRCVADLSPPCG